MVEASHPTFLSNLQLLQWEGLSSLAFIPTTKPLELIQLARFLGKKELTKSFIELISIRSWYREGNSTAAVKININQKQIFKEFLINSHESCQNLRLWFAPLRRNWKTRLTSIRLPKSIDGFIAFLDPSEGKLKSFRAEERERNSVISEAGRALRVQDLIVLPWSFTAFLSPC